MPNRLAEETSPYLLQHRDNPVDWYPWGDEAFAHARAEDRPVLLSVGYSACHWCHVMEHESFADAETAALMNELFVNIKVDREERPDVDSLYMQAVQRMTGHGGWPMTVFLTPEGVPFYGGTYYPPEPRHGLPSFRQILAGVSEAYHSRRDEVERSGEELRTLLARGMGVNPDPAAPDPALLQRAFHTLAARFDHRNGGFGGAPKFPQPMILDFLLRFGARPGSTEAGSLVERTLDAMADGGIHDHLGGGFHRYTVDARWLVPHFEKMLYDNALLARVYLRGFQAFGRDRFRTVTEDLLAYAVREMRLEEGGFCSSQDADSEGEEGRFYVWSAEEIDDALGPEEGPIFRACFDVTPGGNWEGKNILNTPRPDAEVAEDLGIDLPRLADVVMRGKRTLYARRAHRVWPGRDDKVLTSWNAMMLHAFAEAGRVLDRPDYVQVAVEGAEFLLRELRVDGRLLRTWRAGTAKIDAFLEDHALLADALIELYFATFDLRWVHEARSVADRMIKKFWDPEEELFYDTPADGPALVVRPRDVHDNATPSGSSAAAVALLRLARLSGEPGYERIADRLIGRMAEVASKVPQGFGHLLCAIHHHQAPPLEVAIVGDPDDGETRALLAVVRERFLPEATLALLRPGTDGEAADAVPLLAHRNAVNGRPTAFVCEHYACRQPVTTPEALARELDAAVTRQG